MDARLGLLTRERAPGMGRPSRYPLKSVLWDGRVDEDLGPAPGRGHSDPLGTARTSVTVPAVTKPRFVIDLSAKALQGPDGDKIRFCADQKGGS